MTETPPPIPHGYDVVGQHAADRLMSAQAISSDVNLHGDPPPTRNQVAAVLHALADFTHNQHMLSDEVAHLGADHLNPYGEAWAQATGLGRYFHGLGDWLETIADEPERLGE